MASVKWMLQRAAEIAVIAEIKPDELVACTVGFSEQIQFHLKPLALARVFRLLQVPKRRVRVTFSDERDVHLAFAARGAEWVTCMLARHYSAADWQDRLGRLGGGAPPRIAQVPLALTFDSPGPPASVR